MGILEKTDFLRGRVLEHGQYNRVAEKCGLNFHWLQKFAIGSIQNPTVGNVAKLEAFFEKENQEQH
jgi:hypothetical protein